MFILPAHAHPFDNVAFHGTASSYWQTWHWLLAPLRLPLTLAATLLVFLLVRAVLSSSSRLRLGADKGVPVALAASAPQKAGDAEKTAPSQPPSPPASKSWFGVKLSWETLPPLPLVNTLAEALPISLHPPPAPPMRGRHVYRGGRGVGFNTGVRRPETALAVRPVIEAPVPAIYENQEPVSMAKMIMSRHTYRRPSPAPRRSSSVSTAPQYARRPPSPELEQHARSASV